MKQQEIQQRRDKILNKVKVKESLGQGLQEAQAILQTYLKEHGMKRTPERDFILEVIYHLDGHFDVDSLHKHVCKEKAYICRVTVYNSLLLFVEAGVVARFQPFANGSQFFEKCIGQLPHGYQVCRRCGAIKKLSMQEVIGPITEQLPSNFHVSQYCLYAVGLCGKCNEEERHEVRMRQLAEQMDKEQKDNQQPKSRKKKRYTSIKEVKRDRELQALREKKHKK